MEIKNVPCINDRLGMDRKAESRKVLRYKNAHAGVVYRELSVERVDRKNGCIGRKPEYRFNVSAGLKIRVDLAEERLEQAVLEEFRGARYAVHRQTLTSTETVSRLRTYPAANASTVNQACTLRVALLIASELIRGK